jgi:hypothetical protein
MSYARRVRTNSPKGVLAAIEEMKEDDDLVSYDGNEEEDISEIPETDIDAPSEADLVEGALDEAEQVTDSLEELLYIVKEFKANGGMNKQTAIAVEFAQRAATRGWTSGGNMPSMESFDGADGRITATGYAIESIMDEIKNIWKKIVAFVKKWMVSISNFWNKHVSDAARLKSKADALYKKAQESKKSVDQTNLDISKKVWESLGRNGAYTIADLNVGLEELTAVVKKTESNKDAEALINARITQAEEAMKDIVNYRTNAKIMSKAKSNFKNVFKTVDLTEVTGNVHLESTATHIYFSGAQVYLGNKQVIAELGVSELGEGVVEESFSIAVKKVPGYEESTKDEHSVTALDSSAIAKLAQNIKTLASSVQNAKTSVVNSNKSAKKLLELGDKLSKQIEKADSTTMDADRKKIAKGFVYSCTKMAVSSAQPAVGIQQHAMSTGWAAFNFAAKCYSNLKSN